MCVRRGSPGRSPVSTCQEVLSVLWYRKWSILAVTLLTVGVALLVSSRQTPIYESQASVLVTPIDTGADTVHAGGPEPRHRGGADLVGRCRLDRSGQPRASKAIRGISSPTWSVDQPTDTEILDVTYRDPDPVRARRLAMGFAEGYLQFREAAASKLIVERAKDLEEQIGGPRAAPEDDPGGTRTPPGR